MRFQDITGQRFGNLVVLRHHSRARQKDGASFNRWECQCDCGNVIVVRGEYVKYAHGRVKRRLCKSCTPGPQSQGGLSGSAFGRMWRGIIDRCENEKNPAFHNYGGRGIKICERWRNSIPAFAEDMGPRPSPKHSVDRAENNGHYSCGKCDECVANGWTANCRWATAREQVLNSRRPRFIECYGERLCLTEWASRLGITREAMRIRANKWRLYT